jgi:flagellar assembly protein FliH
MNDRPLVPSPAPREADAATQAAAHSVVLRDVAVRGQVSLARPRAHEARPAEGSTRTHAPNVVPVQPARRTEPNVAAPQPQPAATGPASANDGGASERRGYDEGLAQGRAQAAEEARQAAARADQALQKATRELEARFEQQAQAARERGEQEQATLKARLQKLDTLLATVPAQIEARLADAEDDMLALCFESVCKILGAHAVTPEGIRAQLAHVRTGLRGKPLVAVHLHPDDLAVLRDATAAAGGPLPAEDGEVQWVADPALALGGCILQSPQGGIDARLETQLRALARLLAQSRTAARAAVSPSTTGR